MLKIQSFEPENLEPVLSGILSGETTPHAFTLCSTLLKVYPVEETFQVSYLIISALQQIEMIRVRSSLNPTIDKETIMIIVKGNIYEQLKENRSAGFAEYARVVCQLELSVYDDEIIGEVADSLIAAVEQVIDNAIALNYTVEQSFALMIPFVDEYKNSLMRELSRILDMLANNDLTNIGIHFWGWKRFLNHYRIYSSRKAPLLLTMAADFLRVKDTWSLGGDNVLNSIDQIIELEEEHIEALVPVLEIGMGGYGDAFKLFKSSFNVIVGGKGSGKTTLASNFTGKALREEKKVMFYSPETKPSNLLFGNIIPAYIKYKYGFLVNEAQVLGLEEPYPGGSDYTTEEKKVIIQMAKQEIADSSNFMHITEYYNYQTLGSDLRTHYKLLEPDIIIFDHSQEVRGESDANKKTSLVATELKSLMKDTGVAVILLSHPASGYDSALPTTEKPIVQDKKIAAWSQDVETLADTITGIIRNGPTEFKVFFTKLRFGEIPPMFQVLQMNKPHCWFDYRLEDQYLQNAATNSIEDLIQNKFVLDDDDDGEDDDDF